MTVNRLITGLNYTFLHDPKTIIRYLYRYILSICANLKAIFEDFTSLYAICAPLLILFILNILIGQNSHLNFVYQVRHSSLSYTWTIWLFRWNAILRELLIFPGLLYQEGTFYAVLHIFMLLNQLNRLIHLSITYCNINLIHVKAYD